nr:hypothetical protein [Prolixibacteraceae bacterium]
MKRILFTLIALLWVCISLYSQNRELDSLSLAALYRQANGDGWIHNDNWLSEELDTWYGVELTTNGRVYYLNLPGNNLTGTLSDSIQYLTEMANLDLSFNELEGVLPVSLGSMHALEEIRLNNNHFSGRVPGELNNLPILSKLYLHNNSFSGNLPWMDDMAALSDLRVNSNRFTFENLYSLGITRDSLKVFYYSPQDTISDIENDYEKGLISVLDCQQEGNTYSWYLDDELLDDHSRSIVPQGEGNYRCEVKNARYPLLTLKSDTLIFLYNNISDSLALIALYQAALGDHWSNSDYWLSSDTTLDAWFGVTLDGDRRVSELRLPGNNLTGVLPVELASLSRLIALDLENNDLWGDLPPFERMTTLDSLWVGANHFIFSNLTASGVAPADIHTFVYIPQDTVFALAFDEYAGTLTVSDGEDTANVYDWYLDDVLLPVHTRSIWLDTEGSYTGEVSHPVYTGLIFKTDTVEFSYTPTSDSLALVHLYEACGGDSWTNKVNWLTGPLDTWFGVTLDNDRRVSRLQLSLNHLSDSLPAEIGNLTRLERLNLSNNELGGTLPGELGKLVGLQNLLLNGNQLVGNLPDEIGNLTELTELNLSFNDFTGTLPAGIANLIHLLNLDLSHNQFSSPLPAGLDNLADLNWLTINFNQFDEAFPMVLMNLPALIGLELDHNQFSGVLPADWSALSSLVHLTLGDNRFSGALPASLTQLIQLSYLSLGGNQFNGILPAALGELGSLSHLELDRNLFSGEIPVEVGNLTSLQVLKMGNNQLSGSLPDALENLTELHFLSLDSNALTGDLPLLTGTPNLTDLWVAGNGFTFSNLAASSLFPSDVDRFYYAPQDTQLALNYNLEEGVLVLVDDDQEGNFFTWYKN